MTEALTAIVFVLVGGGIVSVSMAAGYWAGRNSAERPFRSEANPRPIRQDRNTTATGEPEEGDIYAEAVFGDDKGPVPTILRQ